MLATCKIGCISIYQQLLGGEPAWYGSVVSTLLPKVIDELDDLLLQISLDSHLEVGQGRSYSFMLHKEKNTWQVGTVLKITDFENRLVWGSSCVNLGCVGKTVSLGSWKKV